VREIAEILGTGVPCFVLFDEMFEGTNLKAATDACLAVLSGFASCRKSAFLVASHISELAEKLGALPDVAFSHFAAELVEGEPVFGYRVRPGVSEQRLGMLILEREQVLGLLRGL
jgi:DNA mismatch repair ATPase MutS